MEIKYRQALYSQGEFCGFHYWGFIDGKFISPAESQESGVAAAKRNSKPYLGYKDVNGKELYAGDFIKNSGNTKVRVMTQEEVNSPWWEISEIIFDSPSFGRIIHQQHNSFFGELPHKTSINMFAIPKCEIIGNIYEHPELIRSCGTCHDHTEHCPECRQDEIDFAKFKNKEEK